MGKQSRLRAARRAAGRAANRGRDHLVTRPFEGLPSEGDWIALREFVPAATAKVRLSGEYADRDVTIATVLPGLAPALAAKDGRALVAIQAQITTTDASRELGAALLAALSAEPGTSVDTVPIEADGPRLQDLVDPNGPFEVTVHDGFDFWLQDLDDPTGEIADALEQANAAVTPSARLSSVDAAYWAKARDRCHIRWVMPHPERTVIEALARLHAAGESALGDETRLVGSFRAHGLLVPVWDLPVDMAADAVEEPAAAFAKRFADALAVTEPLNAAERRARDGLLNRQLTIR